MSHLSIPANEVGSCVLCNGPDALELGVCLDCASRTGDGLLFVRQSIRRADRARVIEHLQRVLPPGVDWEAFDLAAKGYLPLASVPLPAAEQVLGAFAHENIPTHVIPKHWGVAPVPPALTWMLLSVLVGAHSWGFLRVRSSSSRAPWSPVYFGFWLSSTSGDRPRAKAGTMPGSPGT